MQLKQCVPQSRSHESPDKIILVIIHNKMKNEFYDSGTCFYTMTFYCAHETEVNTEVRMFTT